MVLRNPLSLLNRDLKILFWSTFLWTFGLGIYNYVWPLFLKSLNANPADVGLVYSIGFLAIALSMIPGGILANKYDLKPLVVLGWVVSIPVPLIYYFSHTWPDTIPGFILLEASGFNLPAFNAYIVAVGQRGTASANFGTVFASAPLGIAIGPAIGAVLLTTLTIRDTFLVSFVLFVISSIVVCFIRPLPAVGSIEKRSWKIDFPKTRSETSLLIFLTCSAIAYGSSSFFFPLYFNNVLDLSPILIQILGSAQQFGAATFAVILGRRADVSDRGKTMALGIAVCAIGVIGALLSQGFLLALPMIFLFGAVRGPSIIGYSILSNIRKGASRAGQYGMYLTFENLGLVTGSSIGGVLFTLDPRYGFISSLVIFVGLIVFLVLAGFGMSPKE